MKQHRSKNRFVALIMVFLGIPAICSCTAPAAIQSQPPTAAAYSETPPDASGGSDRPIAMNHPSSGSLWDERGSIGVMFINAKARQVGDILTIKIVESSSATNKATTETDRKTGLEVGLTSFFKLEDKFPASSSFFNPFSPAQAQYESEFEGEGSTVRSGALSAFITARIVQVLPNGNFIIEGNREVRVNNENQVITLTGVIRPRDISAENVILSTYIADARISYSGTGIVNDQQRPGWLTRILDNVWPF